MPGPNSVLVTVNLDRLLPSHLVISEVIIGLSLAVTRIIAANARIVVGNSPMIHITQIYICPSAAGLMNLKHHLSTLKSSISLVGLPEVCSDMLLGVR